MKGQITRVTAATLISVKGGATALSAVMHCDAEPVRKFKANLASNHLDGHVLGLFNNEKITEVAE